MNEFESLLEETKEIGYIKSVFHSVGIISGLPHVTLNEMIISERMKRGFVHGLIEDGAEVLMLDAEELKTGEKVVRTGRTLEIPVGEGLLGRIVNPLCESMDELKEPISGPKEYRSVYSPAIPIMKRKIIKRPLETGVMVVDLMVPIGYGQRELIIGDAKTGKTSLLLQIIANQVRKGLICVYVGIGKKDPAVKAVKEYFKKQMVLNGVVIVHTSADDSLAMGYLAPYTGITIAEFFRDKGHDVIVAFDDLTTHAKIYRQISLLLKRNPGRDSYPGDIFHIHAELLERAGNFKMGKEVSITAFPLAETLENDISGFIQTNLIAMTDGHLFFDIDEFQKGKRPAINIFLSVSRVGNQTKTQIEKELAGMIRRKLDQYYRILELAQFGGEISLESRKLIEFGKRLEVLLTQSLDVFIPQELQIILVGLLFSDFWVDKPLVKMREEIQKIIHHYHVTKKPSLNVEIKDIVDPKHLQFIITRIIPQVESIIQKNGDTKRN